MRFRIIENKKIKETPYEIFYFDENNSRGPKWLKVVWDEESYIHFCDKNFVATIDVANTKAKEFYEKWTKENGKIVSEFEIN